MARPLLFPTISSRIPIPVTNRTLIVQSNLPTLSIINSMAIKIGTHARKNQCLLVIEIHSSNHGLIHKEIVDCEHLSDCAYYTINFNEKLKYEETGILHIYSHNSNKRNYVSLFVEVNPNSALTLLQKQKKTTDINTKSLNVSDIFQQMSLDMKFDISESEKKIRSYNDYNKSYDENLEHNDSVYVISNHKTDSDPFLTSTNRYKYIFIRTDQLTSIQSARVILISMDIENKDVRLISKIARDGHIPVFAFTVSKNQDFSSFEQENAGCIDGFLCAYQQEDFDDLVLPRRVPLTFVTNQLETSLAELFHKYKACMTPKVSLVTILDLKKESVSDVLKSYFKQSYKGDIEFILIDDFHDQDMDSFSKQMDDLITEFGTSNISYKIMKTPTNSGNCVARNFGVKNSTGDIVIIIDFDCYLNKDFISSHVQAHKANDCDVVIGPCNIETNERDPEAYSDLLSERPETVLKICELQDPVNLDSFLNCITRNFSIKRKCIVEDLFDPIFSYSLDPDSGFGWEDIEMGYRLYKRGLDIKFTEDAISIHISHPSTVNEIDKPRKSIKNYTKLFIKHPELSAVARRWFYSTLDKLNIWSESVDPNHKQNEELSYLNKLKSTHVSNAHLTSIKQKRLRILTYRWHVPHQYELYKTPQDFFLVTGAGTPFTNHWEYGQRPLPANAKFINIQDVNESEFDLAILHFDENVLNYENTNNIIGQDWGANFRWFMENIHLPKVAICHGTPQFYGQYTPGYDKPDLMQVIEYSRQNLVNYLGDILVICNSYQAQSEWGFKNSKVIWHGFDPTEFMPATYERGILSPSGQLVTSRPHYRGLFIYDQVFSDSYPMQYLPENLKVPEPDMNYTENLYAIAKYKNYINTIRKFSVYFNPTQRSPMPRARCEPMMCGVVTVNAHNHDVDLFIKNGVNGFYSNDPNELRDMLLFLMKNPSNTRKIGAEARNTAINIFNHERYLSEWQQIILGI